MEWRDEKILGVISVSRRSGRKEEIISVFERFWGVLEQKGVSRPSLGVKEERSEI